MKRFLFFLGFISFLSSGFAQTSGWVQDSSRSFIFNNDEWQMKTRTYLNKLDEYGHPIDEVVHKKNYDSETWVNSKKITASYYNADIRESRLVRPWNIHTHSWGDTVEFNGNDEKGNEVLRIFRIYYEEFNDYDFGSKYIKSYNENNKFVLEESYHWISSENLWRLSNKFEIEYDEDGNRTEIIVSNWDETSSIWTNNSLDELMYDTDGNEILRIRKKWNNFLLKWENYYKIESTYSTNGNKTVLNSIWDINLASWLKSYKNEYTYDNQGNKTESYRFVWNSESEEWINRSVNFYTYNEAGNRTGYISRRWDSDIDDWKNIGHKEFSYDDYENRILNIRSRWDEDNETWVATSKIDRFWSKFNPLSTHSVDIPNIEVYPNPTDGILNFEGDQIMDLAVYDANGQLVKKEFSINNQLDINDLSSGLYFLEVNIGSQLYIKKIYKE